MDNVNPLETGFKPAERGYLSNVFLDKFVHPAQIARSCTRGRSSVGRAQRSQC